MTTEHELGTLGATLQATNDKIGALHEIVERGLEQNSKDHAAFQSLLVAYDNRLQGLERWRAWTKGVSTIALLGIGATAGWIRLFRG